MIHPEGYILSNLVANLSYRSIRYQVAHGFSLKFQPEGREVLVTIQED